MRSKTVTLNGQEIKINEYKIKELKSQVLPKIEPAFNAIANGETSEMVTLFSHHLREVFPEIKDVDFDECYPSEIEAFVEAWIDTNFFGLRRVAGPLVSLVKTGQRLQESALAERLASQTTGKK